MNKEKPIPVVRSVQEFAGRTWSVILYRMCQNQVESHWDYCAYCGQKLLFDLPKEKE